MAGKETQIGRANMNQAPQKPISFKLKDNSVSDKKLSPELRDKINDYQNQIDSIQIHGMAVSNEFGNDPHIGISQKKLSEEHNERIATENGLQDQINAIIMDKAIVNLVTSPSLVFIGEENVISLTATTNTSATSIKIKKGSTEIATGSGLSLNGSDTITHSEAGNTTYTAEFIIAGLQKITTKNVEAVYPIMYGGGDEYTDAQTQASIRITPAGTYNVTVPNNGDYVFFVVPRTMNINSAKMSGFDFPLQAPVNVEIDGVEYKYYQSANTYDAGALTIVIS